MLRRRLFILPRPSTTTHPDNNHTKNHTLQCTSRLFYAEDPATGIDRVTTECDTAKMSIYNHFASKDGLICAVLAEVRTSLLGNLRSHALHADILPIEQLEAAFNILCYAMGDPEVRADLIVRALLEFPQPRHPVHQAALDLEHAILNFLQFAARKNAIDGHTASFALVPHSSVPEPRSASSKRTVVKRLIPATSQTRNGLSVRRI